jgi:putative salt-induced outer membrane protein YdiY
MRTAVGALVVTGLVVGFGMPVLAQGTAAPAKKQTETTVAVGATATDGNSQTEQLNASVTTEGENKLGSFKTSIEGNYSQNTSTGGVDDVTANNIKASANVKKTISAMTFGYVDAGVLHDNVADVSYRATVGPGLGAYAIKNDATKLSGELGPAYVWEQVGGETDNYPSLRVAQGCEHKFSDKAKVWENVEWLPELADFNNYQLNAEVGVEAAINALLNTRVVLKDRYDSLPAAGREHNDLTFIVGLSSKF